MSGLNAISIVSIQYELILNLRHGDELVSMMKRFMRTCVKRLGATSAQFYFGALYPDWDQQGSFDANNLKGSILKIPLRNKDVLDWSDLASFLRLDLDEAPGRPVAHFTRFGRHCYAIPVPPVGVLVLQKGGAPFEQELIGVLEQVAPKIAECCSACVEREQLRQEIALRKQVEDKLQSSKRAAEEASFADFLTGLSNRRALAKFLEPLHENTGDAARTLGVILVDLDNFKRLNDRFGHNAGDTALRHVARVLMVYAGDDDFAGRIGGDEFLLILNRQFDRTALEDLAEAIITNIAKFDSENGYNCGFGASVGISIVTQTEALDVVNVTSDADEALYEAKRGRNRFCFFDDCLRTRNLRRSSATEEIRDALARGEFVPYLQPQFSLADGSVIGAEALVRWEHPVDGVVHPSRFLTIAGDVGLLDSIDAAIFIAGLETLRHFDDIGLHLPKISFNVTASKLSNRSWLDYVTEAVDGAGLARERITFEIVESIMFEGDADDLISMAKRSVERGFKLHLDDFGTGHASISALRLLPFSCVKIDKTFVRNIDQDKALQNMMAGIVRIIHGSQMTALAEGVETAAEARVLTALGIDHVQGFRFARPMDIATVQRFLSMQMGKPRLPKDALAR